MGRLPIPIRGVVVGTVVACVTALAGAGLAPSLLLGLVVGGAVGAVGLRRSAPTERIEPTRVGEPWRHRVSAALAARRRFERTLEGAPAGPLTDRLNEMATRLDVAVRECWEVAQRGHALDNAVGQLGIPRIQVQLAESRGDPEIEAALRRQLESAERLAALSAQTHDRLRRLNADLDEAVARAIELSVQRPDAAALRPLGSDIDGLIIELTALQRALEETGRT